MVECFPTRTEILNVLMRLGHLCLQLTMGALWLESRSLRVHGGRQWHDLVLSLLPLAALDEPLLGQVFTRLDEVSMVWVLAVLLG